MTTVREIEAMIEKLSPADLAEFRQWFQDFDAYTWDRQFEADARVGRLDALAGEALADLREGRCRDT
jgi:hypothetical protein